MYPVQTQSLPTWAPSRSSAIYKPTAFDDEDPLYLSGEETDCESERGSDTLSRDDEQLMACFINLQRARARKQVTCPVARPAEARTSPVLIPSQTRKYVAKSTKRWLWDDDDEKNKDCDQCPCCNNQSGTADEPTTENRGVAASELLFDLEL
ncbi:unnamed protein product [Peronospora destructor]|uniref:Uncharacterized protein n=1 Tax=Peronospora destructor TaxID=86335 RepID=A0AAV0UWG6_9STRA|nr:unnamed protein product [Peronospora destructor]